jgi:antitoxin component of RelBE/YafQ-DinJ toxin-antitoxin module
MTMLSFRVDDDTAVEVRRWSARLGIDRSELLRDALRVHLTRLASEDEPAVWAATPRSDVEAALDEIAKWGPAEDWSDWSDASR